VKSVPFLVLDANGKPQHSGAIGGPLETGYWLVQFNPNTPDGVPYRKVLPTQALLDFTLFEDVENLRKFLDKLTNKPLELQPQPPQE